jgi:hypothetical protein
MTQAPMRWYQTPIEDGLSAEEYLERAARFHHVAKELPPEVGARFAAMAADAIKIAHQKEAQITG